MSPFLSLLAIAAAMPSNSAAEHPVAAVYRQGIADFNRHDLKAFMRQFGDDIEMYTPSGWVRGKAAVQKRFADLFEQMPRATLSAANLQVRQVSRETAVVEFEWQASAGPGTPSFGGVGTGVYVRRKGTWAEVLEHETLVLPHAPK